MSRLTRRRTHGRKRTHKRGSGNTGSVPNLLQEQLNQQRKAALKQVDPRKPQFERKIQEEEQQRRAQQSLPKTGFSNPRGKRGGAKHEHAVTIVVD